MSPIPRFARFFTFEWKLRWTVLAFFVAILPMILVGAHNLETMAAKNEEIIDRYSTVASLTERLRFVAAEETAFAQLYVLTANQKFLKKMEDNRVTFRRMVDQMKPLLSKQTDVELLGAVMEGKADHDEVADLGLEMRKNGMSLQQIHTYLNKHRRNPKQVEFGQLDNFAARMGKELHEAKKSASLTTRSLIHSFTISSIGTLIALLMLALTMLRLLKQNAQHDRERADLFDQVKRLAVSRKEAVEVVSHDLQVPLTALLLRMQLLRRKIEFGQDGHIDVKKDVERLVSTANSMKDLIRNLLDQAKIEAGTLSVNLVSQDLTPLLEETVEMFRPIAIERGLDLIVSIDPHLPQLRIDASYLQRAVANLISNAIKFTPTGGCVEIGTVQVGHEVQIWVKDNGAGIDEVNLPFVFNRFWQSQNSKRQGTGLGLSIVKGISEAHGGHVGIESQRGKGTCVFISLPFAFMQKLESTIRLPQTQQSQ